jgi:hypothetical protein
MRVLIVLTGMLTLAACRRDNASSRSQTDPAGSTASPYSAGSDSGARNQQLEGTSTGTQYEAPQKIPGVTATLGQLTNQGHPPTQTELTPLRNQLGHLEDAMRSDFSRAGLADTGEFRALSDSLSRQLGGGPGGLADEPDRGEFAQVKSRAERLILVYNKWMATTRK